MTAQIDFLSAADDADRPSGPVCDVDTMQEEIASLDRLLVSALDRRSELAARIALFGGSFSVTPERFDDLGVEAHAFTGALNRMRRVS